MNLQESGGNGRLPNNTGGEGDSRETMRSNVHAGLFIMVRNSVRRKLGARQALDGACLAPGDLKTLTALEDP